MLSGDVIRLLEDAYSNRFPLGSVSKIMRWCLTPYRANEVSKPQQKETYGKYVSIIFSIPVWLNKQTNKAPIFLLKQNTDNIFQKAYLYVGRCVYIINHNVVPPTQSWLPMGLLVWSHFYKPFYFNPLPLKCHESLPQFLLSDLGETKVYTQKREINVQTMKKCREYFNSEP